MKRKNLILKNNLYLSIAGISILMFFIYITNASLKNTIGDVYNQNIQDSIQTVQNKIVDGRLLKSSFSEIASDIPNDMIALLLYEDEVVDLNIDSNYNELFYFVKKYVLDSKTGHDLISQNDSVIKKVLYRDERNQKKSFYLSLDRLKMNNQSATLLLSKDSSAWETYLLRSKFIFFLLLLLYLGLIFYFYHQQQKKIYTPIKKMTELAFEYSQYNFRQSLLIQTRDEIGELATAINKMGKTMEAGNLMNKKEKSLLRLVFDSLAVGVIYVDKDLTMRVLNSMGEQHRNLYENTVEGKYQHEIGNKYHEMIEAVFSTQTSKTIEIQYIQSIYKTLFSPLFEEEKKNVKGVLLIIEDITEAKRLSSIREDLITNVSHDFRTPLATIKGYSEAIIDDIAETIEDKNEMAKIIFDEANELHKTINSLLSLSRINAGHADLQIETVRLKPFFSHIISRFKDTLKRNQIKCSLIIEDNLEYYDMDEEKMSHVIYNLIDNAIRYSAELSSYKEKFVAIEVRLDTVLDEILFTVTDNGLGISEESIPYIFERFFKDDKARSKPKQNGTGIGLSLVQSIVKEHGGKVEVLSKLDEGTTFIVRLPYKETTF